MLRQAKSRLQANLVSLNTQVRSSCTPALTESSCHSTQLNCKGLLFASTGGEGVQGLPILVLQVAFDRL